MRVLTVPLGGLGPGGELEMDILGTCHRVTVIPESLYDPENQRPRS